MAELKIEANPEYTAYSKRWARVRAFNNGGPRLKEIDLKKVGGGSDSVGISFLRKINPGDTSEYNTSVNTNNINGAVLYNTVVKTRSGLMGMLYRKPPVEAKLPDAIDYIYKNVDGSGLSMVQQSRSVSSDVVSIGRDGLLTDMPRNDEGVQITKDDVTNGFRASIQEYKAESIVDWHESIVNNVKVLDMLILCESVEVFVEGSINTREIKNRYKVYRFNDGVTVQIFTEKTGNGTGLEESEEVEILGAGGNKLLKIPFEFVGSKNNQPGIDGLPLEPIAEVNAGHYQESANLAGASFQLSVCQPVISDDNYQRFSKDAKNNGKTVPMGPNAAMVLGSTGSFALVAPPANTMAKGIQDGYRDQMLELGAQIITPNGGVETAEAAKLKHASNVSDLGVISENVSEAYTRSIEHVCFFMGVEYKPEYRFDLNSEFFDMSLTAEDAVKWVSVWQGGAFSKDELDSIMVKGKAIGSDVDLEAMNKDIADNAPSVDLED
jgi:hypothetical protein